jgi:hypothetical protein
VPAWALTVLVMPVTTRHIRLLSNVESPAQPVITFWSVC